MKLDSNFVFSKIDALEFGIMSPKMIQNNPSPFLLI